MINIYLIRHGQADSLGKDYDNLTELGKLQALRAGEYFRRMNIDFDIVASGSLNRQRQTLSGIEEGMKVSFSSKINIWDGLNEFDGKYWKQIAEKIGQADTEYKSMLEKYRALKENSDPKCKKFFFNIMQRILYEWVNGSHSDIYPFEKFHSEVISVLKKIPTNIQNILLVSSATPVAILSGYSLDLAPSGYLPLMKVISNTSLSIFSKDARSFNPITINIYPHLQSRDELSLM